MIRDMVPFRSDCEVKHKLAMPGPRWRPGILLCHAVALGRGAGAPESIPMALISSSTSGQCTPSPEPMISKFWRCFSVASDNRHDQANGTLTVLPSARVTANVESVTSTLIMRGSLLTAMLIPCLHNSPYCNPASTNPEQTDAKLESTAETQMPIASMPNAGAARIMCLLLV